FRFLWETRMLVRDKLEIDTRSNDYLDVILEGAEQAAMFIFGGQLAEWAGWVFKSLVGRGASLVGRGASCVRAITSAIAKTKGWKWATEAVAALVARLQPLARWGASKAAQLGGGVAGWAGRAGAAVGRAGAAIGRVGAAVGRTGAGAGRTAVAAISKAA